ncbi:PREDICTED: uncharacterized protein LOC108367505 [Rhagoletis zephyria]|uniref:uncharacterized protein LOC108367505 n=1 Tax=Rhagoletis zephyria TaxID=28612 RepID=UPI0008113C5B|nr:PREDICTED: uncharacterized protein LOC108367505 [Rhagoletis zephyria]
MTVAMLEQRGAPDLILASLYMPYDVPDPPSISFRKLTAWAEQRGINMVAGCDANAHHTAWSSSNTNDRGESLFSYLLSTKLTICNKGNHPTFYNRIREEVIDITLVTNSNNVRVDGWHVSTKCSFSDHCRIVFSINLNRPTLKPYRNPRRTNWNKFSQFARTSKRLLMPCD